MITVISISNGQPAMAPPLAFVVIVSMIKDGYEDYKRHKSDDKENYAMVDVYDTDKNQFISRAWHTLKVGQIVRVK